MIQNLQEAFVALELTRRGSIRIHYDSAQEDDSVMSSKVLGEPYWEADVQYPLHNGEPLRLLAQINWAQVHQQVGDAGFSVTRMRLPKSGITQMFLDPSSETYGLRLSGDPTQADGWRVVHWPQPSLQRFAAAPQAAQAALVEPEAFPATRPASLRFTPETMVCGPSDEVEHPYLGPIDSALVEQIYAAATNMGSHIAGYPEFCAGDPRLANEPEWGQYRLLFQLDSEGAITWGTMGVANWLIDPADLARGDFSRIFFHVSQVE